MARPSIYLLCLLGLGLKPILAQQQMPAECMVIVEQDPMQVQSTMSDQSKMGKVQECMDGHKEAFETKTVGSGECTQEEIDAQGPPCEDPTCISAVKREVPKLVDKCMPADKFPVVNPLFQCLMNHADDECPSSSIMAFSKPTNFVQGKTALVLKSVLLQATKTNSVQVSSTIVLAGVLGMAVGAALTAGVLKRMSFHKNVQEPLLG